MFPRPIELKNCGRSGVLESAGDVRTEKKLVIKFLKTIC